MYIHIYLLFGIYIQLARLYINIYIYICICIYVYIHMYMHIYSLFGIYISLARLYIYVCIYIYIYTCIYITTYTNIYTYLSLCTKRERERERESGPREAASGASSQEQTIGWMRAWQPGAGRSLSLAARAGLPGAHPARSLFLAKRHTHSYRQTYRLPLVVLSAALQQKNLS